METYKDIPVMRFADTQAWHDWLDNHYDLQSGVWIQMARKGTGIASISRAQALDIALCYGWIDGQAKSLDTTYFLQKFTPRRAKSMWSKVNVAFVEKLIEEGRMQPPGFAAIESAKADGRWDAAYASPKHATMPDDLAAALAANPQAQAGYDTLNKTNQYAALWQLMTVKTPQGRQARLEKLIALLAAGKKPL